MTLIRILVLVCIIHNVRLYTVYVTSRNNEITDALSRLKWDQWDKFTQLIKGLEFNRKSEKIPEILHSMKKLWMS